MTDSILNGTKKALGLAPDYTEFDSDIIMHINSAFSDLNQLGVGPDDGFMIEDEEPVWIDFLGPDKRLNSAKTFVYYQVRLAFDPPSTPFHITAMQDRIREIGWRLNVTKEETIWKDPRPVPLDPNDPVLILDGGSP